MKLAFALLAMLALPGPPARADKKLDDAVAKAEDQLAKDKPEEAVKTLQKAAAQSPGSEAQVALGNLQARLGNFDDATAAFKKAQDLSATEPAATKASTLSAVASYHLSVGAAKDALAAALAAVQAQETPETLASLARAQVRCNDAPAGLETADKAIAANGSSALAHEAKGVVQASMELLPEAIASFRKAVELDPKLTRARAELASALASSGKGAEAVAEARKATAGDPKSGEAFAALGLALLAENPKNWSEAIAQAQQGAFLNPKSPLVHVAVGVLFEANGQVGPAVSSYKSALETDPGYAPARLALVKAKELQGDWKGARDDARKLAEDLPNNGEAQYLLGRAHMRASDYTAALPVLEKAAALSPGNAEAHALLANAAFSNGKNDQAVAAYTKALELKPDNLQWRTDYGLFLARNGDFEAGAAQLNQVVNSPGYKDAAGFANLGYVYRNMKPPRLDESIAAYKRALELDPKEEQAALGLAWSYLSAQTYDDSIATFNKVLELEPKLAPDVYNGIGWCYYFKKDMARAEAYAAKAKAEGRLDARLVEQIERYKEAVVQGAANADKAIEEGKKAQELAARLAAINAALQSKSPEIRSRALRDLVRSVGPESVPSLIWHLVNDKDWGVKQMAASLLGKLGPAAKPAVPYLKQCSVPCCDEIIIPKERMDECMACEDTRSVCQQSLSALTK